MYWGITGIISNRRNGEDYGSLGRLRTREDGAHTILDTSGTVKVIGSHGRQVASWTPKHNGNMLYIPALMPETLMLAYKGHRLSRLIDLDGLAHNPEVTIKEIVEAALTMPGDGGAVIVVLDKDLVPRRFA